MNKLRVLLVAAALLTAACGAATVSSSPVKSVWNSGNLGVDAGANAGTNVAAQTQDDLGRPNPPIHKGTPVPVQQSQAPATTGSQPSIVGTDRCSAGYSGGAAGSSAATAGKHPPLPECAVE
jgi:hypothetical protein